MLTITISGSNDDAKISSLNNAFDSLEKFKTILILRPKNKILTAGDHDCYLSPRSDTGMAFFTHNSDFLSVL